MIKEFCYVQPIDVRSIILFFLPPKPLNQILFVVVYQYSGISDGFWIPILTTTYFEFDVQVNKYISNLLFVVDFVSINGIVNNLY